MMFRTTLRSTDRFALALPIALFLMLSTGVSALAASSTGSTKRTEIRVPAKLRTKLKDLSQSLRMIEMTPIVNKDDEVICLEISTIMDKAVVTKGLKAEVGDCVSEVVFFKKDATGKVTSETQSLLSPKDAMLLYQKLIGATRIDVDLKRKKQTLPMSYILD